MKITISTIILMYLMTIYDKQIFIGFTIWKSAEAAIYKTTVKGNGF